MSVGTKWFVFCGVLATGEALAFYLPYLDPAWPLALCVGGVATLYCFGRGCKAWPLPAVFCAGAALAWVEVGNRTRTIVELAELNRGRPVEAEFKIPSSVKVFEDVKGFRKIIFPGEVRGIDVTVNLHLAADVAPPRAGEIWVCKGWLGLSSRGGLFGRRRFWVRGKGSSAKCAGVARLTGLDEIVRRVRDDLSSRVGAGLALKGEIVSLNKALLLGVRSEVDGETRRSFADSGTAHLFAVSGLHVFVIGKFLSILLALTGLPSRFKVCLLIPLIWFYVLIVGAGPSSVRAAVMATFHWSAAFFWRKSDPLVAWAQAFALVHIISPLNLLSTASQLSFAVMLGLVSWNRIAIGLKEGYTKLFVPTIVAWAAGVPIVAATFAVITPGGLLANLAAVPIAALSVMLTAAGTLASYISTQLAGIFNAAAYMTTSIMVGLARVTAASGWSNFKIEPWSFMKCIVWYAVVAGVLAVFYHRIHRPAVRI